MEYKTKRSVASIIIRTILIIACLAVVVLALFSDLIFGQSIIGATGNPIDWVVANYMVLVKSVVIIIAFIFFAQLLKFSLKFATKFKKNKTMLKLLNSILKYVVYIAMFLVLLSTWGVNTTALWASAGILGLVIGLGAQSLISDIISGMFIVFEKEFSVDDIVIIDGYRGKVLEIGIRTTKVLDVGGNIKIINNSKIGSVINLTNELSLAICDVAVEQKQPLEAIEAIIAKNLDDIKKQIPEIQDGPYYKGVAEINKNGLVLKFIAKCPEDEKFQTQRDLNRAIKLMFDKNGIDIPRDQIVINKTKVFKRSTKKDGITAKAFIAKQRVLSKAFEDDQNDNR